MTKLSRKRIHFMGIGGSGMAGAAILAKACGYQVSGCDLQESTAYSKQLAKKKIKVFVGHEKSHIKDVDILCVTPAAFFQNKNHEEMKSAKKIITWQQFLGDYLQKDKRVICISGTHGKSTTTAMASNIFEKARLDPWVMIGAINPAWDSSSRVGNSEYFIVESDEFFDNFLSYKPETIILNNIEYDHPDYFKTEKQMYESFASHIKNLTGAKNLIVNQDSPGIKNLLQMLDHDLLDSINLMGYTLEDNSVIQLTNSTKASRIKLSEEKTEFSASNKLLKFESNFALTVPGKYNISNALGVITLAALYKINMTDVKEALKSFSGIGRRLQLLGNKSGVSVYDDYAHHPTAIKATLSAVRQKYPKSRIWAIVEPHTFSRTKALLPLYKDAFVDADSVIIAPIFRSRDTKDFGISGQDIVRNVDHKNTQYIDSFDQITDNVMRNKKDGDVVVVMGAGKSYELSKSIFDNL